MMSAEIVDRNRIQQGHQRFLESFLGEPDRVPLGAALNEHALYRLGLSGLDFAIHPTVAVRAQLLLSDYYDLDSLLLAYDCYNIEAEALGQRLIYTEGAMPDLDSLNPLIRQKADLDRLVPPRPGESGRMPYVLQMYRLYQEYTGIPARPIFCAPFSLAVAVRGYTQLIGDIRRDPSFARQLFDFLTEEVIIPWIRAMAQTVPEAPFLLGADAWAALPNIDLAIQEAYVVPYALRLQEVVPGAFTLQGWGASSCAEPERFLETLLAMRIPYIYGMDPDPQRLGPQFFKAFAVRHGLPLSLGIDADLLRDGPIERIVERVRAYLQAGAPGGKFSLSLNYVPADTPPAHIAAAMAAVKQFGNYPLGEIDSLEFRMPEVEPLEDFLRRKGATDPAYFYAQA